MNFLFSNRSNLFIIRIVSLAFVLFMTVGSMIEHGFRSDLVALALLLGAWFLIGALITGFQRRLKWHENTTCLLTCAMDSYFLMTTLNLAATPAYMAMLALAAFCFAVAFAAGPMLAGTSCLTGLIGFVSAYFFTGDSLRPSLLNAIGIPLLGLICGLAWRIVVPMLWKAIQIIAANPDAVNRGVVPGAAEPEIAATPDAAAAISVLEEEKARLIADMENVRAEVDLLKILSAKRQKSFEAADKEKQQLKLELESARKEMEKISGMDGAVPTQSPAPGDAPDADPDRGQQGRVAELENELAATRARLEQVESEKEALAGELEKTNAELMKAYGA